MTNLVLHCGGKETSIDEVASVATPEGTDKWCPIPHVTLVEMVQDRLVTTGAKLVNEAHALNHQGQEYFGLMELEPAETGDYATVIGLRNSHNRKFCASFCLGSEVFVCDNLAFSGEVTFGRRHSRYIMRDLPLLIEAGIGKLYMMQRDQDKRLSMYKESEISRQHADHLMVEMLRLGIITSHQAPKIVKEWDTPSHDEFKEDGNTVWRLFNAATETVKSRKGLPVPKRTQALHGLMDLACGGIELEGDYEIKLAA